MTLRVNIRHHLGIKPYLLQALPCQVSVPLEDVLLVEEMLGIVKLLDVSKCEQQGKQYRDWRCVK